MVIVRNPNRKHNRLQMRVLIEEFEHYAFQIALIYSCAFDLYAVSSCSYSMRYFDAAIATQRDSQNQIRLVNQ